MNFKSNLAPRKRVAVDLSRKLIPQFIELPPYAKDPDTGKYLNESHYLLDILKIGIITDVYARTYNVK